MRFRLELEGNRIMKGKEPLNMIIACSSHGILMRKELSKRSDDFL